MLQLWRDLRFGLRLLVKRPGFAAAAILSLVLGIGLNTATFTLLDAIFLRPLPAVEDVSTLAAIYSTRRSDSGEPTGLYLHSHSNFLDLRQRSRSFEGLAIHQWAPMNFSGGTEPVRAYGTFASAGYFEVFGLKPALGRFFLPEEDATPGTHRVLVLSHGAWTRLFGSDPGVLDRTVRVNGQTFTVVGVAPRGFKGVEITTASDFWLPMMTFPEISPYGEWFENRGVSFFHMVGRLRPGVERSAAETELVQLSQQLESEAPKENEGLGARVLPLLEGTFQAGQREQQLGYGKILAGAVGLILLISCLNVAHLLVVRGLERRRELAVRRAQGASRGRLMMQLLTENLVLFFVGAAFSLPVSLAALRLLWHYRPPQFDADALQLQLDYRTFAFAFLIAAVTGLIFGLIPAWRATRLDPAANLAKTLAPSVAGGKRSLRPRRLLVLVQVALTLVALIAAGLFLRSLQSAYRIDLGFDSESLLAVTFAPGEEGYERAQTEEIYSRVLELVRALPGVTSAMLAENRLLRGAVFRRQVFVEGSDQPLIGGGRDFHRTNAVFPGYFETAGIPLVRGRDFDDTIQEDGPLVAIVNQTMADTVWPGEDPIGQRFHFDYPTEPPIEVIGVARDARYRHVQEDPQFFIYLPATQAFPPAATLHVRTDGDPARLLAPVRQAVHEVEPELPLADVQTLTSFVAEDLWQERTSATLLGIFGVLALLLATLGIYGVLAQTVQQERREIGLRIAIGARRADVLRWIVGEGLTVILGGLVVGLLLSFFAFKVATFLSSKLIDVEATDPLTFATAAALLLCVALLGCLVPALRAVRTDPAKTLREE